MFPDDPTDAFLGFPFQVGVHGQAENFPGNLFGNGEIALVVAQMAERLLEVKGNGVVDRRGDLLFTQFLDDLITA